MFILLPIPRPETRFPTLTTTLVALTVLVFLVSWPLERSREHVVGRDQFEESARSLDKILLSPGSDLQDPDRALLVEEEAKTLFPSSRLLELYERIQADRFYLSSRARFQWDAAYPVFQSLKGAIDRKAEGTTPFRSLGFRRSGSWFPGILTHQFLHAGFWHLFFNMLFLWVAGSVLETWVGGHFLWIYLAGGGVAAIAQSLWGPSDKEIMVGASGAIAALMGFALFALPRAKVKLFYLYLLMLTPRHGSFESPLWFCVPLWLLQQMFMAMVAASLKTINVGYVAHIGGFVFGSLVALLFRLIRPLNTLTAVGLGLAFLTLTPPAQAAPRFEQMKLPKGEPYVTSALVDERGGYAYFGIAQAAFRYTLEQASASIVRVRLADFTRADKLTLPAGENPLGAGIIDHAKGFLYFGIYGDPNRALPAKVVKIRLSDFKRVQTLGLGKDEYGVSSAAMDSARRIGYFGTLFGSVASVRLDEMTLVGSLGLQREENAFQCALIDRQGHYGYFGTSTGNIMKIRLSDFTPLGNLTVLRGEKGFRCGVVDPKGAYAYFGTEGSATQLADARSVASPAKIVRIALADFRPDGVLTLEAGETDLLAVFVSGGVAYFVSAAEPIRIIRVSLAAFKRLDAFTLPAKTGTASCAAFDPIRKTLYIGAGGAPAMILKVSLDE